MKRSFLQTILPVFFLLAILSCQSKSKGDKKTKQEDTVSTSNQPVTPKEPIQTVKKCYSNEGLKYKVSIMVNWTDDKADGLVTSETLDGTGRQAVKFDAVRNGNKLQVTFAAAAPAVGDASEWTDQPWTLDTSGGTEKLQIVFNAKNYDTNKWSPTTYTFDLMKCE